MTFWSVQVDHRDRFNWAEKNRVELHREIGAFIQQQPYVLHAEDHPDGGVCVCRFTEMTPFPPDWSLRVGDIVNNFRSSLDNLVYSLAQKRGGHVAAEADTALQYPICDTREGFHGTTKKNGKLHGGKAHCIALLSDEAKAAVEGLQQYTGSDPTQRHPIAILRDISNVNKHKRIVLTHAVVGATEIFVRRSLADVENYVSIYRGPIEHGAVAVEFPLRAGETAAKMNVDHLTAMDVSFANERPAYGRPIRPFLTAISDFIRDTIFPKLEDFLK